MIHRMATTTQLPVHGQGVFLFTATASPCAITVSTADQTSGLRIEFAPDHVHVTDIASLAPLVDPKNKSGLSTHAGAYYWFSLDSQNQRLYAGVGEARLETAVYAYTYPSAEKAVFERTKQFLESLTTVSSDSIRILRVQKDPINLKNPLVIKHVDELTIEHIASSSHMPIVNLPPICQKLYQCISGKKFVLNTPDFPDFAQAIEYSIRTPGRWCHDKLQQKSREFNPEKPNLLETYLRITLGDNNGESPGIPYVMEIWPVGHYSPVHSHANANAIIRVLNGSINVSLYPFLCAEKDGVAPFSNATFNTDDVTWITPMLNQTHQLKNLETNSYTCITIQCYMYTEADRRHYDYFDYLDADGAKQTYEPDSDMDFLEFKERIRAEWAARSLTAVPVVAAAGGWRCWKC
jgi:hypothetical protein